MQDDPNMEDLTPRPLVERDQWELAFEPFVGETYAALRLGFNLAILRAYLDAQTIKCRHAIQILDLALEVLFPHTEFHDVSFGLFIRLTEGKLTFEEEQILNALGVKF